MQNPKLSIITPVFQGSKYMAECIESVAQQNCDTLEHIIIDGGSTDGTVDILKEYAAKYEHIRYISEKDEGQSSAMNKGLKMAKGAIIGFLNADYYYETN
ncbi:MAG: glycosyltransferase, partial [Candidatus Omnitrophica bacterium]|nr:glycosyltransferase [Candidatus Omnitrophota bacterium]